jgi:hypothetical protein
MQEIRKLLYFQSTAAVATGNTTIDKHRRFEVAKYVTRRFMDKLQEGDLGEGRHETFAQKQLRG